MENPCNLFQKWYKDTHNKTVEVQVDGLPTDADEKDSILG